MDESVIQVGLAEDNQQFCQVLQEFFSDFPDIRIVGTASNGLEALDLIQEHYLDVLLLDMIMPKLDGIGVLERMRKENNRPHVIIFSAFGHDDMTRKAVELGADYYIVKPFDLTVLAQRIRDFAHCGTKTPAELTARQEDPSLEIERAISQVLHKLQVPAHFKGYAYLRTAIYESVFDPSLINEVTKRLYPLVAAKFGTTCHRVERSIRFAIETVCAKSRLDYLYRIMGYTVDEKKGKPTNASFIAKIADQIRLELKVHR